MTFSASPVESISKHMRWQIALALVGILLLATLLGYSTYNVATVLIPDEGGVFREGIAGNPQYLNPLLCNAGDADMDLCALLYRGLTRIDKHGQAVPDLAAEWTVTNDTAYTFRLKPDQFWHDGTPITADDILFTFGILQDPNLSTLPGLTGLWRSVIMEKVDDMTVRFTLSEPFTPFLDYTAMGLLPAHIWRDVDADTLTRSSLDATPIGSGPLRVEEIEADHILLTPSEFYPGKRPYLDGLDMRFYPDYASLFTAFQNGEIDGVSHILPAEIPAASQRDDLQLFSTTESSYLNVIFNLNNPDAPFLQDDQVRQALYYGLDRQRLIDEAANGQGLIADSPFLPENWAHHTAETYAYDPARANQLLDEAGWVDSNGDGIRDQDGRPLAFRLHTNDDGLRAGLIEQIAADWGRLGVQVTAEAVSFNDLITDFLGPRSFDSALVGWEQLGDPDPYPLWHSTQATGGGQNYSGWDNPEADAIMEQARAIIDETIRAQLYARFQEIFMTELPALPLYYPVYTYGVSTDVYNVQIGALNLASERFLTFSDWYKLTRRVPVNQAPADAPPLAPGATPIDAEE